MNKISILARQVQTVSAHKDEGSRNMLFDKGLCVLAFPH
jgi:hypothetical protein